LWWWHIRSWSFYHCFFTVEYSFSASSWWIHHQDRWSSLFSHWFTLQQSQLYVWCFGRKPENTDSWFELIVYAKSTNSNNRESELYVSKVVTKNSTYIIIDIVITWFGPVYGVCYFAGIQELVASSSTTRFRFTSYMMNPSSILIPVEIIFVCFPLLYQILVQLRPSQFSFLFVSWYKSSFVHDVHC